MNDKRVTSASTAQRAFIILTFLTTLFSFFESPTGIASTEGQKVKTELVSKRKSSKRTIVFSYQWALESQTFAWCDFTLRSDRYTREISTLLKIPPPVFVNKQFMAAYLFSATTKEDTSLS